jgi:cobalt-zinc-cadmium efflux system outer membrane protein
MHARSIVLALTLLASCASTSPAPAFRDVAGTVKQRTGHRLRWSQATDDDKKVDDAVAQLLAKPLTVDGAVQVALLRNLEIQAIYEDLSVPQADVVQAGLLSNPIFSAAMTTAERENISPNLILGITESFLDALLIPAKKQVAAAELDAVKFRVGNDVLDLAARVSKAYFVVVADRQTLILRHTIAEGEQASTELAQRQRDAGNVNDLTAASQRVLYDQARLDVVRAEAEHAAAREELTRLMGLWGAEVGWTSADRLPEVPGQEPPLEHLESRAIAERLDLSAMRSEVQTLNYAVNLAKSSRWTGVIDIGVDVARLNSGTIVVGPRGSIELPIFDQRQATIARLEARLRASEQMLAARAIEVRSEVRDARNRVLYARQAIDRYQRDVIPHREQVVALSQQQYDAMLLGVYQLIQAKQNEIASYREYIETVRDYWIAKTELQRATGGTRAGPPNPPAGPGFDQPLDDHSTHQHR